MNALRMDTSARLEPSSSLCVRCVCVGGGCMCLGLCVCLSVSGYEGEGEGKGEHLSIRNESLVAHG